MIKNVLKNKSSKKREFFIDINQVEKGNIIIFHQTSDIAISSKIFFLSGPPINSGCWTRREWLMLFVTIRHNVYWYKYLKSVDTNI